MSIMAILAYYCVFNFRGMIASLGTLTELTLFRMYFHGTLHSALCFRFFFFHFPHLLKVNNSIKDKLDVEVRTGDTLLILFFPIFIVGPCPQSGMPNIDFNSINTLNLIKPLQIHICMWVYCAISTLWLISSITLLTSMFADSAFQITFA